MIANRSNKKTLISIPGDKSIAQRAVILCALADGISHLDNFPFSDDCLSAVRCMQSLGVKMKIDEGQRRVTVYGRGLFGLTRPEHPLDAGESGTTARILAGVLVAQPFRSVLTGMGSLLKRPMKRVIEPLRQMGAVISAGPGGVLPLRFYPAISLFKPGQVYKLTTPSAQVKSAMLICSLYSDNPVTIVESAPTRDHTERLLKKMGVPVLKSGRRITLKPRRHINFTDINIPGDISSAAYFIGAGLILADTQINIKDIGLNPHRTGIIDVLRKMGAEIKTKERKTGKTEEPRGNIIVRSSLLKGIRIKAGPSFIDEVPLLAVIATQARGTTVITNAQELKIKESDRLKAITAGLTRMGANIKATGDGLIIKGPSALIGEHPRTGIGEHPRRSRRHRDEGTGKGTTVDSYNDHRIAMSLAVASLIANGKTVIRDKDCINKSFPGFYKLLAAIERLKE